MLFRNVCIYSWKKYIFTTHQWKLNKIFFFYLAFLYPLVVFDESSMHLLVVIRQYNCNCVVEKKQVSTYLVETLLVYLRFYVYNVQGTRFPFLTIHLLINKYFCTILGSFYVGLHNHYLNHKTWWNVKILIYCAENNFITLS